MAIPFFEEDMSIISQLGDYPGSEDGLTTADFKAQFDLAGKKIKEFLNNTLIPSINISIDVDELTSFILSKTVNVNGDVMNGSLDMNGNQIHYLAEPTDESDAATMGFVNDTTERLKTTLEYTYRTVTLASSGWNNKEQTVVVNGVSSNADVTVSPAPNRENVSAYGESEVICIGSGDDSLAFQCESTPSVDLIVNIKFRNLGGG